MASCGAPAKSRCSPPKARCSSSATADETPESLVTAFIALAEQIVERGGIEPRRRASEPAAVLRAGQRPVDRTPAQPAAHRCLKRVPRHLEKVEVELDVSGERIAVLRLHADELIGGEREHCGAALGDDVEAAVRDAPDDASQSVAQAQLGEVAR